MDNLSARITDTINFIDGYETGNIIVEEGKVTLYQANGKEITLDETYHIEVLNGEKYEVLNVETILNTLTAEGWPGYAGLYARVKKL